MLKFNNAKNAIRHAQGMAPAVVAWVPTVSHWTVYHPTQPVSGSEPEILCVASGVLPIPLSDIGGDVLWSAIQST